MPRVTDIAIDPSDATQLWASIEVDAMRRGVDGGATFEIFGSDPEASNAVAGHVHGLG